MDYCSWQEVGAVVMTQAGSGWRGVAVLVTAQWLAVSVFEAVIDLPRRLTLSRAAGVLGRGSPVRFHAVLGPVVIGSTALALIESRREVAGQGSAILGAVCTASAIAATAVAVVTVNVPLLKGTRSKRASAQLVRRWHHLNALRIAFILGSLFFAITPTTSAIRRSRAVL